MKRIIFIAIRIIVVFFCLNLIKNLYLFFTYEHENINYCRVDNIGSDTKEGNWKIIYDTYIGGYDERNVVKYHLYNDSTGQYFNYFYGNRIFNLMTQPYSWLSILPYDESQVRIIQSNIVRTPEFIIYISGNKSFSADTQYSKYEFKDNILRVDVNKYDHMYNYKPRWTPHSSEKLDILPLLYVGLFTIY